MTTTIDELAIRDDPRAWEALGFEVDGDVCVLGAVRVRLIGTGEGRGLAAWSLRGFAETDLDGLATSRSDAPPPEPASHPNGITGVDHVVAITPRLERTVAALRSAGLDLRRIREEPTPAGAPRQAFFRLGEVILEVIQQPDEAIEQAGGADRPAFFWGLALTTPEIAAAAARLGEHVGSVRDAVQPGRRIATLRRSVGLSVPVALITPPPPRT